MDVERAPRQVIEDQLLVALDDKSKVAIIATERDLEVLIHALTLAAEVVEEESEMRQYIRDLEELRDAAFS